MSGGCGRDLVVVFCATGDESVQFVVVVDDERLVVAGGSVVVSARRATCGEIGGTWLWWQTEKVRV